jgi:multiple sugar transport system ATP-binding protein
VLVGIRPDALVPLPPHADQGQYFAGRVRTLEYHGHEWLAYLEAGLPAVPVPEPPDQRIHGNGNGNGSGSRAKALLRRLLMGRSEEPEPEPIATSGTHRRADLIVRLGSRPVWRAGDHARVAVDMSKILLFTPDGARIDRPLR